MEFIQGDILDKKLIKELFKNAHVVHHLAGVTNVPRTKNESNIELDEKIKLVGQEGTQNILDSISDNCKIIFPSTHVVYEGIDEVKTDLSENEDLKPVLSYSSSKAFNEEQLKKIREKLCNFKIGICLWILW